MSKPATCDVCNCHNPGFNRRKCKDCPKMLCAFCRSVLQEAGGRCPNCREARWLRFVKENNRRKRDDQISIYYQGDLIYGIPWIGKNIQYAN
jgi:hypothetical protein